MQPPKAQATPVGNSLGAKKPSLETTVTFSPPALVREVVPRPIGAGVLTIVGAFFILLGGVGFAVIGAIFAVFGVSSAFFFLGLLVGALTLIMGVLMIAVPSGHTVWGVLAIVFALVSIVVALGGFIIGFILTLVGGILAVTWKAPVERFMTVEGRTVPPPPN